MKPHALVIALVILATGVLGAVFWYLNLGPAAAPSQLAISPTSQVPNPATPMPVPQEDWEVRLEKIVHSALEMEDIADRLIVLFPTLPVRGKEDAAQHICDNVSDETYAKMRPLTVDAGLGEEVLDVFYTDLGNRDERVRLPVLLEIAKNTRHPFRTEAAEELTFILDTDPGKDFARMEAAMISYLKELEDEM
ncbi:hypothetical protein WJU23_10305 [Prosthecobacter sp. SYSU 5D2]|uniref:hypothetical protein n=1 Tax=Prosthecobacter sp. SYSU 5D2 TaxID=3134134 RepID=UPI0031FF048C